MAKNKTQGWYTFENGMVVWFAGLSVRERQYAVKKYGKILKFEPTNF